MTEIVPGGDEGELVISGQSFKIIRNWHVSTAACIVPMVKGKLSLLRLPGQGVLDVNNLIVSVLAQSLNFNMYYLASYNTTSVYLRGRVSLSE